MKTAISIPDDTFAEATRKAAQLGISRSQFFVDAVRRYLQDLEEADTTTQVNVVLAQLAGGRPDGEAEAVEAGRRRLAALDDTW